MTIQKPVTTLNNLDWEKLHDRELLNIYQTGNREESSQAFYIIYKRYESQVKSYIEKKRLGGSKPEDVLSDVWFKACKKFKTFEWRGIPLNHWLISTTKYLILEGYRKEKLSKGFEIDSDFTDSASDKIEEVEAKGNFVTEKLLREEADLRFFKQVKLLKNDLQRKILILHYFRELSFKEIAEKLGKTAPYIRVNHGRALKKLHKHLPENREALF